MSKLKTRELTIGAMLIVLSIAALYMSTVLTNLRLSLLLASSIIIAVSLIETGIYGAVLVYIASFMLGIIFIPDKLFVLSYAGLFGIYPIAKNIIERKRLMLREYVAKVIFFNCLFFIGYRVYLLFIPEESLFLISKYLVFLIAQVLFLVYDLLLTVGITYYLNRIKPKIR